MQIFTSIKILKNKYYIISQNIVQAQTNTKERAKELAKEFKETDKKIFSNLPIDYWIIDGKTLQKFEILNRF